MQPHKFLVHVNVNESTGPLRFLVEPDFTVEQVMKQALKEYDLEARLPALGTNVEGFDLYPADDFIQALDKRMKIADAECREFFLHMRQDAHKEEEDKKDGGLLHGLAECLNPGSISGAD